MKKNIYKKITLIIYLCLSICVIFITTNYMSSKEKKLLNIKYEFISNSIKNKIATLIEKKQNATLALTITLANDYNLISVLHNKKNHNRDLKKLSSLLRKETSFKNVWFQVIDKEGISLFRSWSKIKNDNISILRSDLRDMLKKPKITTSISVGRYDITFKAMVPIYKNNKFIGIIESITHFNSISRGLRISNNLEPIILVEKKFTKQLKNPFTKLFLKDYYIANISVNKQIVSYLSNLDLEKITSIKDFIVTKDFLIINYPIIFNNNKLASFIVLKDLSKIDISSIKDFENNIFTYLTIFIIILGLILYLISHTLYSKELYKLNNELEANKNDLQNRVDIEIQKNYEKNKMMFQQNKMAAMGEMIANIAHQWRQPLSIISTAATGIQLQKKYELLTDKDFNTACNSINTNAQYLSETINDFRNFISGEKVKTEFYLSKTIQNFLSLVDVSIKSHHINIILQLDEKIKINAFENELMQCFINIFNNAKDILKDKNDEKHRLLIINTTVIDDKVIIKIKDNAGGIDEKILEKIFEPYFTTKHKSQGTGLGLHMTYSLIVSMAGDITASNVSFVHDNNIYTGAEFLITLPLSIK